MPRTQLCALNSGSGFATHQLCDLGRLLLCNNAYVSLHNIPNMDVVRMTFKEKRHVKLLLKLASIAQKPINLQSLSSAGTMTGGKSVLRKRHRNGQMTGATVACVKYCPRPCMPGYGLNTQVRQGKLGEELLTALAFEYRHQGVRLPGLNFGPFAVWLTGRPQVNYLAFLCFSSLICQMRMAQVPAFGGYSRETY